MERRTFIAGTAVALVPLAGCLGDDPEVDELLESTDSESFEAEAGDEYDVTIAAGAQGVSATLESAGDGGDSWEWDLGEDEEETDTIETSEDGEYVFTVETGSAFITIE